jgi:BirA family biotin operon repressor/biotin-[acetyl-CoA-carboxylase] ligase
MKIEHRHFTTIDSTNSWAKRNAAALPHEQITLVTAEEQTGGRGRYNRQWVSPPNQNIYASFCFFLPLNPNVGNISQVLIVSAAKVLERLGFRPQLKWPNDLLLSGKKVGGILCEASSEGEETLVIAGVGLNVNMPQEELLKIGKPATSLLAESGKTFDINELLQSLQKQFSEDLALFLERKFVPFVAPFTERLQHKPGDTVRFQNSQKVWEGKFHSIGRDGSLNLTLSTGEVKNFFSGELL